MSSASASVEMAAHDGNQNSIVTQTNSRTTRFLYLYYAFEADGLLPPLL
jgi:hypothetical protein